MPTVDYSNLPLPDVSETEILEAARTKKLLATPKGSVYRWRVISAHADISKPKNEGGDGKGWMMVVVEAMCLKPVYGADGTTIDHFDPFGEKTRTWIVLPRTPSKELLQARGYTPEEADAALAVFNPNGVNDFAINNFTRWARAFYPDQFPRVGGFDKDTGTWVTYKADGSIDTDYGPGDEGKAKVQALRVTGVGNVKAFAGTFFQNPSQVVGKEFFDGFIYEVDKQTNKVKDFGKLAGYPNATLPTAKDGTVYTIQMPVKT